MNLNASEVDSVDTNQYLSFTLGEEVYALEIHKVREVLEFSGITPVPRTPKFLRGVINLRGNVVPVVDLKLKFGMDRTESGIDTCVVIVEVEIDGDTTVLGTLADSVREVIELDPSSIGPPPRIGTRVQTDFVKGMGKHDDHFLIILNVDKVFSAEELSPALNLEESDLALHQIHGAEEDDTSDE